MTARSSASVAAPPTTSSVLARLRAWLYVMVVLCYLIAKVGHLAALAPVLSALSLVAILASLPVSGWATRLLATVFLAGGSSMLVTNGLGWLDFFGAFGEMAYLLALFVVLPVCSVPVKLGGYSDAIQAVLRGRIRGVFQLNCLVTTLAFICGSFMSMAAVPIMMTSMEPVVRAYPIRHKERFVAVSTVYGYALPILWTPVSGVVGVIVHTLHVDWLTLFPVLFALSIACLLANWLIFYLIELRGAPDQLARIDLAQGAAMSPVPRLMQMVMAIVLLIVWIVLLAYGLQLELITVVTLVAIPFALAWSTMIGQARAFMGEARRQTAVRLPRMADQYVIFLSAGFFAQAMRLSGFDRAVNLMFLDLHNALGTVLFLLSMPPMALLASFLGMHPLVVIALLADSLKPELLGFSSMQLAVTLIGSAVLTYVAGPFSGTLGLVQSINRVSTFRLSLWNAPYALGFLMLLSVTSLLI
jgi:hypothetical protein